MNELLTAYLEAISSEADSSIKFDPDKPIKEQFNDFDELDFRLATVKFEMKALIEINLSPKQYDKTLKELISYAIEHSRINKASAPQFLKRKKAELNEIAREMAIELQKIFG